MKLSNDMFMTILATFTIIVIIIGLGAAMITSNKNSRKYHTRFNTCIVSEYESNNNKSKDDIYSYCRAKARLNTNKDGL